MRPLRFGVSAKKIGERRATAEVKTKSREVVNLAGKGRGNWFRIVPIARKNKKIFQDWGTDAKSASEWVFSNVGRNPDTVSGNS
jgi:hypothetical protein